MVGQVQGTVWKVVLLKIHQTKYAIELCITTWPKIESMIEKSRLGYSVKLMTLPVYYIFLRGDLK